jgi:hypothetical protein
MSKHPLTRYAVEDLMLARKVAGRTKFPGVVGELPMLIDIRRVDSPAIDLSLVFETRTPRRPLPGVPSVKRPSASLVSKGNRIRGIDWTIKHEVIRYGVPTGDVIRGWHEHYWTDEDESTSIREPNPPPKNEDMSALITWCCANWNIEGIQKSLRLFNEN